MNITLAALLMSNEAMGRLLAQTLPIKAAYRLKKILRKLQAEMDSYNQERVGLLKKYGDQTGEDQYKIRKESLDDFQREHQELLSVEVTIDEPQFSLEEMGDIAISAADLMALEFLFADPN